MSNLYNIYSGITIGPSTAPAQAYAASSLYPVVIDLTGLSTSTGKIAFSFSFTTGGITCGPNALLNIKYVFSNNNGYTLSPLALSTLLSTNTIPLQISPVKGLTYEITPVEPIQVTGPYMYVWIDAFNFFGQVGMSANVYSPNIGTAGSTSGTNLLAGNGSGGIANVTVGSGLNLVSNTLSSSDLTALVSTIPITGLVYSRAGTVVTVTQAAHDYISGMIAEIQTATDTGLDTIGNIITVVNANTWTFTTGSTGTAIGTLTLRSIIYSATGITSITSNAAGDYTLTFTAFNNTYYKSFINGRPVSYANGGGIFMAEENPDNVVRSTTQLRFYTLYNRTGTLVIADSPLISILLKA